MLSRLAYALLSGALVFAGLAYAAVPGLYRVATPGLFGLANPVENLYTDAPERLEEFRALIDSAEARVASYFGDLAARPVWVLCAAEPCKAEFGLQSNGATIGYHYVVLGPGGLNLRTATHERTHIALHRLLGPADLLSPPFPAWFDEGLATHVAGDTRVRRPADPRDADWITQARRIWDWRRLGQTRSAADRYGAAARLVQEIEEKAGRDGLRDLIEAVAAGGDFDAAYADLLR